MRTKQSNLTDVSFMIRENFNYFFPFTSDSNMTLMRRTYDYLHGVFSLTRHFNMLSGQ